MVVFLGIFAVYCMLRVLISDTLYIIERLGFGRNYFLALGIIVVGIILLLVVYALYSAYSTNKVDIKKESNILRSDKVKKELDRCVLNDMSFRGFMKYYENIYDDYYDSVDNDLKKSFDLYIPMRIIDRIPIKDIDKELGIYKYTLHPMEAVFELVDKNTYNKIRRRIVLTFEDTSNGIRKKGIYREDTFKLSNVEVEDEVMSEGKLKSLSVNDAIDFLRDNKGLFRLRYIPVYIKGYFGF